MSGGCRQGGEEVARPKSGNNTDLPPNVSAHERSTKSGKVTYYYYRDPITRKPRSLGSDRSAAILAAQRINAKKELAVKAMRAGATIQNGIPLIQSGNIDELGLYSHGTIIAAARTVGKIAGIYFLVDAGRIVYIGQSTDIIMRISSHLREGVKTFTSFAVIEAEPEELDDLEARYIAKFGPIYNVKRPMFA